MSHTELVSNGCEYCADQWWINIFDNYQLVVDEFNNQIQADDGHNCYVFNTKDELLHYFLPTAVDPTIEPNDINKVDFYSLFTSSIEIITIASAWKVVGPNIVYALGGALALQLSSYALE